MYRHPNPRIGVCPRCNDNSKDKALLRDIGADALFQIMNECGPFNRRALFCPKCINWAKSERSLRETNQGRPIARINSGNSGQSTPDLATIEDDLSQLSDYQVTLSSPTGLSALNMRPTDLIVTNITSNTNTNTTTNSPMEADTELLYEDISEYDVTDDRTEADRLINTMSDQQQFISNVLNSVDDPIGVQVEPIDSLDLIRIEPLGAIEPPNQLDPLELIQRIEFIQRIEPLQAIEPPNQFANPPIQRAEQPTLEPAVQQRVEQRVQCIERVNPDDPLDDNVPGQYFDC